MANCYRQTITNDAIHVMKKQIAVSAAIASLFAAPAAMAQSNDSGKNMQNGPQSDNSLLFGMLDTDDNGTLSEKELSNLPQAVAKMAYRQMDYDGNGDVSQIEYTTAAKARALRTFGALDSNGDGSLNTDEITSDQAQQNAQMSQRQKNYYNQMSKKMDQNGDGEVSRSEWIQAFMGDAGRDNASQATQRQGGSKTTQKQNDQSG